MCCLGYSTEPSESILSGTPAVQEQSPDVYAVSWQRAPRENEERDGSPQVFSRVLNALGREYEVVATVSTHGAAMVVAIRSRYARYVTKVACARCGLREKDSIDDAKQLGVGPNPNPP